VHFLVATVIAATMLVQAQTAPKRLPDAQMDGLKGAVKLVHTAIERSPGVSDPVEDSTYDNQGRLTARTVYERGAAVWSSTYQYVESGARVEARTYAVRAPVTRLEPKNGRIPPRSFNESGAELFCRTVDADAFGRPLTEFTYTGREPKKYPPVARVVYQYQRGKPSAITYFERYPEVQVRREVYVFDRQLVWNETIVYEPNQPNPERRTWTDTLDPAGNWTRRIDRRLRAGAETVLTYVRTIEYW